MKPGSESFVVSIGSSNRSKTSFLHSRTRRTGRSDRWRETAIVERKLHWFAQIGEFFFRGEQFDAIPLWHGQRLHRFVAGLVRGRAVLVVVRRVVGLHHRQRMRGRIGGSDIEGLAIGRGPHRAIADRDQLFDFLQLIRVIVRTERFMPTAEDV